MKNEEALHLVDLGHGGVRGGEGEGRGTRRRREREGEDSHLVDFGHGGVLGVHILPGLGVVLGVVLGVG